MSPLAYRHVDVFAGAALTGNGLTIVFDADTVGGDRAMALTREFRQFETIFLSAIDPATRTATARIFTVDEELDFAGHPVLGAAAALHERHGGGRPGSWTIVVAGRPLHVHVEDDGEAWLATMAQGVPAVGEALDPSEVAHALAGLGLTVADLAGAARVVSTGLPYLILPVATAAVARAGIAVADFEARLTVLGAKFVYVLDPVAREGRTWDNLGAVEDVATGSAAGPAAAFLVAAGLAPHGESFDIAQGRFAGRPSHMTVHVAADGVSVAGRVHGVVNGFLDTSVLR